MRIQDIEYRGKDRKTGEWKTGCLYYFNPRDFPDMIHTPDGIIAYIISTKVEGAPFIGVIPETVGQYTGLKDKNGVKIFEGDILKYNDGNIFEVVYSADRKPESTTSFDKEYIGGYMLKDKNNHRQLICWVTRPYDFAEVIGNIHDNPDLLG